MKALAVVAHPDDCLIFARPFMEQYKQFNWSIIYLTYHCTEPRAKEVAAYWNKRNIGTEFLGFEDNPKDLETNSLTSWVGIDAETAIQLQVKQFNADLILTHNANGEYGHIHHKVVHSAMQFVNLPKIYFAEYPDFNAEYTTELAVDATEIPLHKDIVNWEQRRTGRYTITEPAQKLLERIL